MQTIVVFGATGQQGGAVVKVGVKRNWKVKAVTRNVKNAKIITTSENVEYVEADMMNKETLNKVLCNADATFIMTNEFTGDEWELGKNAADAAIENNVFIVFSTLPSINEKSGGKYKVSSYDEKKKIQDYITSLTKNCSFVSPCAFMSNYHSFFKPIKVDDHYEMRNIVSGEMKLGLIDIEDLGKFVYPLIGQDTTTTTTTKVVPVGAEMLTLNEIAFKIGKSTGKDVRYVQQDEEKFISLFPPGFGQEFVNMWKCFENYSYWGDECEGSNDQQNIEMATKGLNLTLFDDYLKNNPIKLE